MKSRSRFLPASIVFTLASVTGTIQAQITFDWKDTAPDSNWSQGAAGARWWDTTNLSDLWDAPGPGILRFSNNHELSMTNNVSGTYGTHGIVFGPDNTGIRTLAGGTVRLFDSSGADPFIRNESSATHVIDLNLEGDGDAADPLKIEINGSGGLTFNGSINNQGSWIDVVGNTTSAATVAFNGVVSGAGGLYKDNAHTTLILTNTNTYSGGTQVNAGVLQIGNGGATGNFGTGGMTIGGSGTLAFNRTGSFNLGAITSSAGAKVQVNLGIVVGTTASSFGSLATGNIVEVANGGTIDLNGVNRAGSRMSLSIAGTGAGGTGAIINSSATSLFADAGILNLILTGNASIGGNAGRYDIGRVGSDSGTITGNNFTLTKIGSNDIVIRASAANNITYVVDAGRLTFEDHNTSTGTNTITVNNGASLGSHGNRNFANAITLNAGSKLHNTGGGTGTWSGPITVGNGATIEAGSGQILTSNTFSASGSLVKSGGDQWTVTGTASITGNLDIQNGLVQVGNLGASGSLGNPGSITLTRNDLALRYRLSGADASLSSAVTFVGANSQLRQHAGTAADKLTISGAIGTNTTLGILVSAGGNLVLANGSVTQVRNLVVGSENGGQTAFLTIENGANITTRYLEVGNGTDRLGTVNQAGGTVTIQAGSTGFRLGHWSGANRQYNLSGGLLDATAISANSSEDRFVNVGWDGQGLMTVGGGVAAATLKAAGIRLDRNRSGDANSASTLTVLNNGLIEVGSLGMEGQGTNDFLILSGGTARATATSTWGARVQLTAASTIDVGTSFTTTQSGVLLGSANLTKTGAGILALSNTGNTFTGKYLVTGGTLSVGADSHFGAVPGSAVADSISLTGSSLRLTGGMTMNANRGITIASGATIHTNSVGTSNNAIIASAITGSGGLTLAGNGDTSATGGGVGGSLQLSGTNTFTGNVRITSGVVDANANFGDAANVIILDGGGLVDKNLNINFTRNIQVGAGGGVLRAYAGVSNNIYAGSISNESGVLATTLRHTDGGLVKLAGDGSGFTGTFNNQRGSLQITANNANWANTDFVQDTNGSTITFNGGGTASIRSLTSTRDVLVQNGMTLNVGSGGITMATNSHWWQTSSGTVGNLTSSTGTLTVTNGAASGSLGTLDHQLRLRIVNNGANPVALVKNNVNSLSLNQANTYSGGTTIHAGRINADNLSAFGTGLVTVNAGGQAFLTQAGTYANSFTLAGNGPAEGANNFGALRFSNNTVSGNVTIASAGARIVGHLGASGTISGNLLGTGNLEINSSASNGTVSLTGSGASHSGTVTVSGGRLNMGSALGGSVVVADGATLGDEGSITGNLTLGSTTGSSLAINPASSGRISAGGNLVLNGVTSLIFTAPFGALGPIAIASYGGTLTDGNGGTLTDSFSVPDAANYRTTTISDNAGVIELDLGRQDVLWTGTTSTTWEIQGSGTNWSSTDDLFFNLDTVTFDDTATNKTVVISGAVSPNATAFNNSSGNDYTVSGSGIGGIGGITKTNTGAVTFTSNNTFTGAVNIQAGSLIIGTGGTDGTLGGTGDITVASGATLAYNRSDTVNIGRRAVGGGTLVQDGTGILRTGQAGNNVDLTVNSGTFQAIEGGWATSYFATANRQIVVNDGGTLVTSTHSLGGLGGTFHRPDMTIHTGGTWQLNNEQFMSAGDLILNGGTIRVTNNDLRLEGGTMSVGETAGGSQIIRTGSGSVTLYDSATFNVADGTAAADLTVSAPIGQSGTRGITKTGLGTMNLDAANTYTGATAVNAGRINVNGSITSATTVGSDAFLGGDGTITGALSLAGTLLPGQGGTTDRSLTINGNVTTTAGSVISFTIDSMGDHDQLIIGGSNSIGLGSADLDVTFDNALTFTNLASGEGADFLAAISSNDFTSINGSWFRLIEGNTSGMFANVTNTLTSGELGFLGLSGTQYAYDADNGQRFWVAEGSTYLVAIPEPGAALLGGVGLLLLLRRRRC